MSVVLSCDKGWFISHFKYSKNVYANVLSDSRFTNYAYNKNLFNIRTPMMRDQEAANLKGARDEIAFSRKRKKRKYIPDGNDQEIEIVKKLYFYLAELVHQNNLFTEAPSNEDYLSNNAKAREAAETFLNMQLLVQSCQGGNNSISPLVVNINEGKYLLPPMSDFVSCDIKDIRDKLAGRTYDFILLDPPWKNKHVKRKIRKNNNQAYVMLNNAEIQKIPIPDLLNKPGFVGVWCTNSPTHIESVLEFFKIWGLYYMCTWYWMKVTLSGLPVCSFYNKNGKKPYERLIFGCTPCYRLDFPKNEMLMLSVPSSIHSHKPPIIELLQKYLPPRGKCLELFARYLLPGWTSVGNQVLSLQSLNYFEMCESGED